MVADKRIPVTPETRKRMRVMIAKSDEVETYDELIREMIEGGERE